MNDFRCWPVALLAAAAQKRRYPSEADMAEAGVRSLATDLPDDGQITGLY